MPLMERIQIRSFLERTIAERVEQIRTLQELRAQNIKEAREKKTRAKPATKTKAKQASRKKDLTTLKKALAGMSPAQIALLKQQYGLE